MSSSHRSSSPEFTSSRLSSTRRASNKTYGKKKRLSAFPPPPSRVEGKTSGRSSEASSPDLDQGQESEGGEEGGPQESSRRGREAPSTSPLTSPPLERSSPLSGFGSDEEDSRTTRQLGDGKKKASGMMGVLTTTSTATASKEAVRLGGRGGSTKTSVISSLNAFMQDPESGSKSKWMEEEESDMIVVRPKVQDMDEGERQDQAGPSRQTMFRPTLKRNRPGSMADLQDPPEQSHISAKTGNTNQRDDPRPEFGPTQAIPIPIPFRPLAYDPLIPLSTPPDLTPDAYILRARAAAHTPRTPPRDLTGVLLGRGVSPSPEGPRERGGEKQMKKDDETLGMVDGAKKNESSLGGFRKGKRRRMMTRTESLGDKDELFSASSRAQDGTTTSSGLGLAGKRTFGRVVSDSWGLVSPDRSQPAALPVDGSPSRASPLTPGKLARTYSVPSPSTKAGVMTGTKTPSPPRNQAAGLGRTTSMPDSPSRPGLTKHSSLGFTTGPVTAGRTIKTYGKRQEDGPVAGAGAAGSSTLSTVSNPPKPTRDRDALSTNLESEINGFLLSSPEKPDLFKPLGSRAVPVQTDSYAELNKRFGVDVEDEDDFGPDSQGSLGDMKAPPSLADLRSRGENRRFMDELGYLRDGLRDQSLLARRSSAIDILSKCTDSAWFDKLRICGQVELLYEDFAAARQHASDECLDLVLLLYVAHIAHNANDLEAVVTERAEDLCEFLLDVIRERRVAFVVSASARRKKNSSLDALREIRKSLKPVGLTNSSRSPLAMASGVLSLVLPNVFEFTGKPRSSLSGLNVTVALISTIQQELSELPARIDLYVKGLDLFPPDHRCDFILVLDALRLLQGIISDEPECKSVLQDSYASVAPLFADLLLVLSHDVEAAALPSDQAQELITLSLKTLLVLTQHTSSWSTAFLQGSSPYMGFLRLMLDHPPGRSRGDCRPSPAASEDTLMSDEEESPRDDGEIMNLALGCLFNIVQDADDNGEPILDLSIGRPCQGQRSCLKQCRCAGGLSALGHLASIFVNQQKRNTDDPSAAFLSGYLALLFSRILEGKSEAVEDLLKALPGDNQQSQIELLIANVVEFRTTYESFQQQLTKGLQRQLDVDADMEIVVDDENSSNMIERALKVYGSMAR